MLRGKSNYPELDVLDSPLLSPGAGGPFSTIPPSALADRIFNDPESWGEDDTSDNDFPQDVDDLAWLTEELEKVMHSAGVHPNGALEPLDAIPLVIDGKPEDLPDVPASAAPRDVRPPSLQRVVGKKGPLRPISLAALFHHEGEDFSGEIQQQISKILESGGIPHHVRPLPRSSVLSPPSTGSSSESSPTTPLQIRTSYTNLQRGDMSPSPINIYSASATLSFLEWYGIYPDTPRLDRNGRRSILQPKSALSQKTPILQVPAPRHASRPSSLLAAAAAPISSEPVVHAPEPAARADAISPVAADVKVMEPQSVSRSEPDCQHVGSQDVRPNGNGTDTSALQPCPNQCQSDGVVKASGLPSRTQTPLPQPPVTTTVAPEVSTASESVVHSREGTPSRNASRRLPKIPPVDAGADMPRTSTPPLASLAASPAPPQPPRRIPSGTGPSLSRSRSAITQTPVKQPSTVRNTAPPPSTTQSDSGTPRVSSVRSPPGGPAGPRTRGRMSSRDNLPVASISQKASNIRQA